jgi:N-acetylglutamate synthase-like GNAT family acetyltransferase
LRRGSEKDVDGRHEAGDDDGAGRRSAKIVYCPVVASDSLPRQGDLVSRTDPPRVNATPLAAWERDGVIAALKGSGVPDDQVCSPHTLFWRYESLDLTPVGFGGLEVNDGDALLHAVVTFPPLHGRGYGRAIVAALEAEARIAGCRALWLLKTPDSDTKMFDRMGYKPCDPADVPPAIRKAPLFASLTAAGAKIMSKPLE